MSRKSRRKTKQKEIVSILDGLIRRYVFLCFPELTDDEQQHIIDQERGWLFRKLIETGIDLYGVDFKTTKTNRPPLSFELKQQINLRLALQGVSVDRALYRQRKRKEANETTKDKILRNLKRKS